MDGTFSMEPTKKTRSGSGLSVRGTTYVPPQPVALSEDQLRAMPLEALKQLANDALRKQEE